MKKILIIAVFATMLASCASCGYTSDEVNAVNNVYEELGGKERISTPQKLHFIQGRLNHIDDDTIGETDDYEIVHDLLY